MIAVILIPPELPRRSILRMVLWKVSLNRSPWNHGTVLKKIRPRNCSRGPIRTARDTSARCHLNSYSREHRRCQIAPLHIKHNNQPNSDQDVYASNRHAETKIGPDALRLELGLLARTAFSPRDCSTPNDSHGNPAIVPGRS